MTTSTPRTPPRLDMRAAMPEVARQIDEWRATHGRKYVDDCIKRGMQGEPGWFFAMEGGHVLGTPCRATDIAAFSVQGYSLLLGGDGAAFIRTPKEGGAHAAH